MYLQNLEITSPPSPLNQRPDERRAVVPDSSDASRCVPKRYEAEVDELSGAADRWSDPLEYARRGTRSI